MSTDMYNVAICKILIKRSDVRILKHDYSHHTSKNTQKPSYHRSTFIEREGGCHIFEVLTSAFTPEYVVRPLKHESPRVSGGPELQGPPLLHCPLC